MFQRCEDSRTCPAFLSDKVYDNVVKLISRKFPKLDPAKNAIAAMNLRSSAKSEMQQALQVSQGLSV